MQADDRMLDTSAAFHREASLRYFAFAGLDDELADTLYALDFEPASHPFYPDVAPTLRARCKDRGCKIALISDIHVNLRPEFEAAGIAECFDAFILSFEHGVQKPSAAIFEIALRRDRCRAGDALMVGDRASHDGGAVKLGISTLLLSALPRGRARQPRPRRRARWLTPRLDSLVRTSAPECPNGLLVEVEGGDEGLLRHLDPADLLHLLLAFLLALEQLALARDVTAVALREHVLALRLHRLAGDDAPADRGLDRHVEQLARDQLAQLRVILRPYSYALSRCTIAENASTGVALSSTSTFARFDAR